MSLSLKIICVSLIVFLYLFCPITPEIDLKAFTDYAFWFSDSTDRRLQTLKQMILKAENAFFQTLITPFLIQSTHIQQF